ncbi:MAG: hypothetical protein ABI831_27140 [Betaproteobacteria bacterium]
MQRWIWVWVLLALLGSYQLWTRRTVSHSAGIVAAADPVQTRVGSSLPRFRKHDADIRALARFEMEARVLGVEHYRLDAMAKLVPVDVAFGWGPMSDSGVLSRLSISQGNRFYHWSAQEYPIPRRDIETHSANMHLIAADDAVERQIAAARVGQIVRLSGFLVEVKDDRGWDITSSLTREDTGAGACEVIWVESFVRQ